MSWSAWRLGGFVCAASGLTLHSWTGTPADCHLVDDQHRQPASGATAAELAAVKDWLRQQGADVEAIQLMQSDTDAGRYGVYAADIVQQRAARGLWGKLVGWTGWGRNDPITIASFPVSGALTAGNLAQHRQQGSVLRELLELGVADERDVVILHLAVERLRLRLLGSSAPSGSLAWLALLPQSFSTTLYFSELDMQWLRGTTLHRATWLRKRSLHCAWERLEPAARRLAQAAGLVAAPNLEDWMWASSVFWSRAIAFPRPTTTNVHERMLMQEGLVPGLDFCNHSCPSPCKWTLFGAAEAALVQRRGEAVDRVSLVCPRHGVPLPGQEVTIDYGGKSNEELLFLYGFALEENKDEVLTLMCPLSSSGELDEQLAARLKLLAQTGLRPQVHLPARHLLNKGVGNAADESGSKATKQGFGGGLAAGLALPEGVAETLEVFVLQPQQVQQQLDTSADSSGAGASAPTSGRSDAGMSEEEAAGMRMAVLTTLVRLLELRVVELESAEGTGPLEQDEQLLAAAGPSLTRNQRHALLYRMGQKRLARAYLVHSKQLLQRQMAHLQQLQRGRAHIDQATENVLQRS